MIGELAAATCFVDGKPARVQQIFFARAGAGGEERRVLQKPDHFRCLAGVDVGDALLHERDRFFVSHGLFLDPNFGRADERRCR